MKLVMVSVIDFKILPYDLMRIGDVALGGDDSGAVVVGSKISLLLLSLSILLNFHHSFFISIYLKAKESSLR
jgi:hypothetical protein